MSIVSESRNTEPNRSDKCELVITNPCFNNHFYPTDLLSLSSFNTDQTDDVFTKSKDLTKTAIAINKIKNPECDDEFELDKKSEKKLKHLITHQKNSSKKSSPLYNACKKGDIEMVRKLIQKENADPMKPEPNGLFPIHTAIIENKIECVTMLLYKFACSPNVVDKNKMTGLHHACFFGYEDIVRILVDHPDIDLITKDIDGKSCIDICEIVNSPSSKLCAEIIRSRLSQPSPKINIRLMDGSDVDLNLVSGSNTTVEQLHTQLYSVLPNKNFFFKCLTLKIKFFIFIRC